MCGTAQRVSPHSPIMRLLPTWQRRGRRLSDAAIALDAVSPRRKRICPPKDDLLSPAWRRFFWRAWEQCQQVPRRASMSLALPTATPSPAAGPPPAGNPRPASAPAVSATVNSDGRWSPMVNRADCVPAPNCDWAMRMRAVRRCRSGPTESLRNPGPTRASLATKDGRSPNPSGILSALNGVAEMSEIGL